MQTVEAQADEAGPVERVYRHLEAHLSESQSGGRLPSERALAARFGVSRQSVRAAFRRLNAAGRIVRVVGSGSYATAGRTATLPDVAMLDVLEMRHILEPMIAALATSRATGEDFARIRRRLDDMRQASDPDSYKRLGYLFWQAVARATRNPLLVAIYQLLTDCRERLGWTQTAGLAADARRQAVQVRLAEAIFDALQVRDGERARSLAAERTRNMLVALADPDGTPAGARSTALDI
ncbi:MAG TPA: FCD domain-containing protein [Rhodopila sp.]|uniref:FadR/GntR family transcriptional regulator n=1 Tax=Rhodopila sp. TaxID=2480087 RepID=UPI002BEC63C4|nr:FCD domain-containing protein [Rhodopila sp.]HVY15671.1 FCD domain-containing protein [Rhodopila sp.]